MAFSNEVRLIIVAGIVDNVRPGGRRLVAMRRQRVIEPGRTCVQLGRKTHLRREASLNLERALAGLFHMRFDAEVAPRG